LPQRRQVNRKPTGRVAQDIVFNNIKGHDWFVPADLLIGRYLDDRLVASFEISIPIIKEFTLYDLKLD
jgi:hypothetical protein